MNELSEWRREAREARRLARSAVGRLRRARGDAGPLAGLDASLPSLHAARAVPPYATPYASADEDLVSRSKDRETLPNDAPPRGRDGGSTGWEQAASPPAGEVPQPAPPDPEPGVPSATQCQAGPDRPDHSPWPGSIGPRFCLDDMPAAAASHDEEPDDMPEAGSPPPARPNAGGEDDRPSIADEPPLPEVTLAPAGWWIGETPDEAPPIADPTGPAIDPPDATDEAMPSSREGTRTAPPLESDESEAGEEADAEIRAITGGFVGARFSMTSIALDPGFAAMLARTGSSLSEADHDAQDEASRMETALVEEALAFFEPALRKHLIDAARRLCATAKAEAGPDSGEGSPAGGG